MTSRNGNFSTLLSLCEGNPPVPSWFPSQRDNNTELWIFFFVEQTVECFVIWDPMTLMWLHCNGRPVKSRHRHRNYLQYNYNTITYNCMQYHSEGWCVSSSTNVRLAPASTPTYFTFQGVDLHIASLTIPYISEDSSDRGLKSLTITYFWQFRRQNLAVASLMIAYKWSLFVIFYFISGQVFFHFEKVDLAMDSFRVTYFSRFRRQAYQRRHPRSRIFIFQEIDLQCICCPIHGHVSSTFQEADLAVASLTITYERQHVIDFSTPYQDLGLTILMAKESPSNVFWAFLSPFEWGLWAAVAGGGHDDVTITSSMGQWVENNCMCGFVAQ